MRRKPLQFNRDLLRAAREVRGISQHEVHRRTIALYGREGCISQESVSAVERGFTQDPGVTWLCKVACTLQVPITVFLEPYKPGEKADNQTEG